MSGIHCLEIFLGLDPESKLSPRYFGGGLKDQDRIFQNIYGEPDTGIEAAMQRGDWYKTGEIVQKVTLHID